MTSGTTEPEFSLPGSLGIFTVLLFTFDFFCRRFYIKTINGGSTRYFSAEKELTLLALLFFALSLFACDLHYYLSPLSFGGQFPALVNIGGLSVFFLFLTIMWRRARPAYQVIFERQYSTTEFLTSNIKTNLPIVLPWVALSLSYDLLALLPFPGLTVFLRSETGEYEIGRASCRERVLRLV